MGRLEMYLFVLVLLAIIVNLAVRNIVLRYGLITVISACMFAIHQASLFTYFAVIYMICVCNVFRRDRVAIKELVGSAVVGITSAVLFLYFHFFSHLYINFDNVDDMVYYVGMRTNLNNNATGLFLEYFSEAMGIDFNCYELDVYRLGGLVTTFLLWPLVITAVALSIYAWRKSKSDGTRLLLTPYPYLTLFNLMYIPLFLFENDWGRWFGAVITAKTIEFLYLYHIGDEGIVYAVGRVSAFVRKRMWIAAVVLLYLASFEKFASALFPESVNKVYDFLFPYL
jgi:hypothetical protein